jgi:PadR family transcriptional regulator PadR
MCCIVLPNTHIFVLSIRENGSWRTKTNQVLHTFTPTCPLPFISELNNKKHIHMNIENTASQMRKGVLEFCVLSVIRQGEAYPSDIIEKMKAANFQLLEGTLYPLLTRLKNAGMVNYRWVESSGGPPRKYFSLTDSGLQFYRELELTWEEMVNAVKSVIEPSETTHT